MKNCDVGLISWHYYTNVGSNLQAYALAKVIKDLGYSCEYINYRKNTRKDSLLRHMLKEVCSSMDSVIQNVIPRRLRVQSYRFVSDYIPQSEWIKKNDLGSLNGRYKMYMCGSDQIWASNVLHEVYLLSFADDYTPKFSYASSIGLPGIPNDKKSLYIQNLKRFEKITVREKQGADLLSKLLGIKIDWVLDPTFLVASYEWKQIARHYSIPKKRYIFCYFLGKNPEHREWVDNIAKKNGLEVICISSDINDRKRGWYVNPFVGPREFVGYIDKADLVMTDSFHGMALSINLNKDFYVMERFKNDDSICQNSRIVNILNALNLNDRLVKTYINNVTPVNYKIINENLEQEKERSLKILKNMLKIGCTKGE